MAHTKHVSTNYVVAHKMIADLCEHMANEVYEAKASRDNTFYKLCPDRAAFVRQVAPELVTEARQILAKLLADPDIPQAKKDQIHDALVKDAMIPESERRGSYELSPIQRQYLN